VATTSALPLTLVADQDSPPVVGDGAVTLDDLDVPAAQQARQPLVQVADHLLPERADALDRHPVDGQVQPEPLRMGDGVEHFADVQHGLGRDTAPMQAGAADLVGLDDGDGLAARHRS